MSRIYLASSWKNEYHQALVDTLRSHGHKVYDFKHHDRNAEMNTVGFHWSSVDKNYKEWTHEDIRKGLQSRNATVGFLRDFHAMQDADTCVLLLPCGRSAHVEAGWFAGQGKRVIVFDLEEKPTPELMYLMFDHYCINEAELLKVLAEPVPGVCRVCGCSEDNPCYHPSYGYCWWVEPSLCSHCAEVINGKAGIKDDPKTVHCVNDESHELL